MSASGVSDVIRVAHEELRRHIVHARTRLEHAGQDEIREYLRVFIELLAVQSDDVVCLSEMLDVYAATFDSVVTMAAEHDDTAIVSLLEDAIVKVESAGARRPVSHLQVVAPA